MRLVCHRFMERLSVFKEQFGPITNISGNSPIKVLLTGGQDFPYYRLVAGY
jgi:hypothetical protein